MAEKQILDMSAQKIAFMARDIPFTPLELYLDPDWQAAVVP